MHKERTYSHVVARYMLLHDKIRNLVIRMVRFNVRVCCFAGQAVKRMAVQQVLLHLGNRVPVRVVVIFDKTLDSD